jgi:hypothetical protein
MSLMPAFLRFPEEAAIIGRLLAGYGEIEYLFAMCLASSASDEDTALRTFFSVRGEGARLDVGHNLMWKLYEAAALSNQYTPVRAATLFATLRGTHFLIATGPTIQMRDYFTPIWKPQRKRKIRRFDLRLIGGTLMRLFLQQSKNIL